MRLRAGVRYGGVALLVNRTRVDLGVAAARPSLGPAFVVYAVAWLGISMLLPRGTDDPGGLSPGVKLKWIAEAG